MARLYKAIRAKARVAVGWMMFLLSAVAAGEMSSTPAGEAQCQVSLYGAHPHVVLTNGSVNLLVYLPDEKSGYYRSSRFDWSGIIACATYRGHSYFGEWFDHYDPEVNDAVTGPAEEFRASDGQELGYTEAPAGGLFVKPGVGVLRKTSDRPYQFGTFYPIVDHGKWKISARSRKIVFTQQLRTNLGYSYTYTKTLELDAHRPVFVMRHNLRNTGMKPIETAVYSHDFFMLDNTPITKDVSVELGFTPIAERSLGRAANILEQTIQFTQQPDTDNVAQGYLKGFQGTPGEYRIHLRNSGTRTGILQSSSSPISNFYFWSTSRTVCPEAYIGINVAPGKEQRWAISYELEAQ